ncbi:MAG TPA: MDR family MFS transporter [Polyangiaceae bacterium]|nr:MDR family MFS transporter [Polyangiaceae bacterium]
MTSPEAAPKPHRPLTVAALLLAMFMAAMEATVVATVMPTVIAELGGIHLYGWVGASYLLASTVSVPLYGRLADLRGRKPVLLLGIVLFLAGSVASGLAQTAVALIAFRALQGLGAGAMQPVALTVVGDLYSLSERGKVQAYFGAIWGIAGISGPLLGGLIVRALSWRWVFFINLPFGLASMAVLAFAYREAKRRESGAIDWAGAFALTASSVALLLGASGVAPLATTAAGVALAVAFVALERRAGEGAVLPLALLGQRAMAVASLSAALLGWAMMSSLTYAPLFVQGVLGGSPTAAGAVVAPMLVGWPVAATLTGRRLSVTGFRAPVRFGAVVIAASLVAFAWAFDARAPALAMQAAIFAFGVGMGVSSTSLLVGAQSSVGWGQRGVATATNMFARTMGGALGVGAFGSVLAARLGGAASPEAVTKLLGPERDRSALAGVSSAATEALAGGLTTVMWAIAGVGLANGLLTFFYPEPPRSPEAAAAPAAAPLGE